MDILAFARLYERWHQGSGHDRPIIKVRAENVAAWLGSEM